MANAHIDENDKSDAGMTVFSDGVTASDSGNTTAGKSGAWSEKG